MIDLDLWTIEEQNIFKKYQYKCVHCRIRDAATLHELVPKSLTKNWNVPENRAPLCAECHEWAHSRGTDHSRPILMQDMLDV